MTQDDPIGIAIVGIDPERCGRMVQPMLDRWEELVTAESAFNFVANGDLLVWVSMLYVEITGVLIDDLLKDVPDLTREQAQSLIDGVRRAIAEQYWIARDAEEAEGSGT